MSKGGSGSELTTAETVLLDGLGPVVSKSGLPWSGSELITAEMVLLDGLAKGLVPQTVMSNLNAGPGSESGEFMTVEMLFGAGVLGSIAGAGVSVAAPNFILPLLGFGATGVANGTIAALIHSYIGNVTAGSLFALLQSAGVVGAIS
jgi:hypothetical protein